MFAEKHAFHDYTRACIDLVDLLDAWYSRVLWFLQPAAFLPQKRLHRLT